MLGLPIPIIANPSPFTLLGKKLPFDVRTAWQNSIMAQYTVIAPIHPGLPPPPNHIPDFQDPFTLATYQTLTVAGCIITTTAMLTARMYTKMRIMRAVVLEDWTCCIGWAFFISFMAMQLAVGNHGGGKHQWNVTYEDVQYNWLVSDMSLRN